MDAFERMFEKKTYTDTFIRFNACDPLIPVHAVIISSLKYFENAMKPEWQPRLERESGMLVIPVNIEDCTCESFVITLRHIYDLDICKKFAHCACDGTKIDMLRKAGKACDFLGATAQMEHFTQKILNRTIDSIDDLLSIYDYARETESTQLRLKCLVRAAGDARFSSLLVQLHASSEIVKDLHMTLGWNESTIEVLPTEKLGWNPHSRVVQVIDLETGDSNVCGMVLGMQEKQTVWIVKDVLKLVFETTVESGDTVALKIWLIVPRISGRSLFEFFPSITFIFGTSSATGTHHGHIIKLWERYDYGDQRLTYYWNYKKSSESELMVLSASMGIGYPIKDLLTFFALEGLTIPDVPRAETTSTHGVKRKAESEPVTL